MPTPPFEVLSFSSISLFQGLENQILSAEGVAAHPSAQYLVRYLTDIHAATVVVENDYTDADYLDDFASYYVKCFYPYKRRCKRLHFFFQAFDHATFRRLIRNELNEADESALKKSYLGFVVARPLPDTVIGRTVLATYESDGGRRHYPCTRLYNVNLFGVELSVKSLAFQEQDSVLAACATVSLWSAFHMTAGLFGTPIPTPVEITRVANQVNLPGRPVPSHGLNLQQMCNSIRHVGLEPEVVQVKAGTPVVSLIYAHLAMGLPVILLISIGGEGHAVTLSGYSLGVHRLRATEVASGETSIPLPGLRIDKFYAHDDNYGPFERFHVKPSTDGPAATGGAMTFPVVFHGEATNPATRQTLDLFPWFVIVPVYHKIRVNFLDAVQWLTRLNGLLAMLLQPVAGAAQDVEWDLRLTKSNQFKNLLRLSETEKDRLEELLLSHQPRFIWYASFSVSGNIALELLIDATDMARSCPVFKAIWREQAMCSAVHSILSNPAYEAALSAMLTPRFLDLLKTSAVP